MLTELKQKSSRASYGLRVFNKEIQSRTDENYKGMLRFSLSAGAKNSLALSFFISSIEISDNLENLTLIFDDPVTSFDYSRKSTTINILF